MSSLLRPEETCWRIARADRAGVIIDACDYFRAFYREASRARRSILLAGWQFDTEVLLLRGDDATDAPYPPDFLGFLNALCRERPELEVHILAWDFNPVFALEREWLQRALFALTTPSNLHFRFDATHAVGGSHHQKIVVIDEAIAFTGGMDLARSRWDDRRHLGLNPLRVEKGEPQKPYHDVMAYVTGEAASVIADLFRKRWEIATGEALEAPPPPAPHPGLDSSFALAMPSAEVGLSRTRCARADQGACREILALYQRAIADAERLVYIETQYFTARPILDALLARMADRQRGPLDVVVMLPNGADSEKERLVLGAAQEQTLHELEEAARANGSRVRLLTTLAAGAETAPDGAPLTTFIHAKVLLIDDRMACVGSANLTNRSLFLDSELAVAWEADEQHPELAQSIARLRSELLGEHSGVGTNDDLFRVDGLIDRLDELVAGQRTRLRPRPRNPELIDTARSLHLERLFDPDKPLTDVELDELVSWPPPTPRNQEELDAPRAAEQ